MKVGILTSGGDCQCLNATMRAFAKGMYSHLDNVEIYGIQDGYKGLIHGKMKIMSEKDFSGILTMGGTIIGTSRQSYKEMLDCMDKVDAMVKNYKKWQLDCLIVLGGNGTHKTAYLLQQKGLHIITLPKTIDNDIWGTDMSFGFHSAVDVATKALDCIHTTASAHSRVFIVEVMGHKVGWMTLYAGIAGGADVILIPEIPYDINKIVSAIKKRRKSGKKFTIIAVAEGALSKEDVKLSKKERQRKKEKFPSVSYEIAKNIMDLTGQEVRITIPGHTQRGGSPIPYDRVLSTCLGSKAAEMVRKKEYGQMVAIQNDRIVSVPLQEVAGKLKKIKSNEELIHQAKEIGICFGD